MATIIGKTRLARDIFLMRIKEPLIAAKRRAGQFIILRISEKGERIPLTIVDSDLKEETITIVFQVVGKTTFMLSRLKEGDEILDIAGPLGRPTDIEKVGTVTVVGGGIGIAVAYPIAKAMKEAGNKVVAILGARSADLLILERQVREVADQVIVTTDDGSLGKKGLVTDSLREILDAGGCQVVLAIGPVPMMRAVSDLTRPYRVKTIVSLNPIMVDGTGMCGACRVLVGGRIRFACVDGPEFDAHEVDFADLAMRLTAYREQERTAFEMCRGIT
jgi:ferredoxin--NADP+ reductase